MNDPESDPARDVGQSVAVAGCLYSLLLTGGVAWLWERDRLGMLSTQAIGRHGVLAPLGVGTATAVLFALAFSGLSRRLTFLRRLEAEMRRMFAAMAETQLLAIVLVGAIAEEVFFRLAVQDAFGLWGSVAACVLVNSTTAGWASIPITVLHASVLGLLMQSGFGLLGTTTANAISNYLSLRRILST